MKYCRFLFFCFLIYIFFVNVHAVPFSTSVKDTSTIEMYVTPANDLSVRQKFSMMKSMAPYKVVIHNDLRRSYDVYDVNSTEQANDLRKHVDIHAEKTLLDRPLYLATLHTDTIPLQQRLQHNELTVAIPPAPMGQLVKKFLQDSHYTGKTKEYSNDGLAIQAALEDSHVATVVEPESLQALGVNRGVNAIRLVGGYDNHEHLLFSDHLAAKQANFIYQVVST